MPEKRPERRRAGRTSVTPEGERDAPGRRSRHRGRAAPRAADRPGVPGHRPVACAADPVRVRRGLRRAGGGRAGRDGLRLGPDARRDSPALRARRGRSAGSWPRRATRSSPAAARACMEAANRGCREGGGLSVGCNIELPHEQGAQRRTSTSASSSATSSPARSMFVKYADAFVILPGGFGTLDELFEALTLIQTRQGPPLPGRPGGHRRTGRGLLDWIRERAPRRRRDRGRPTWTCSSSPTTPTRSCRIVAGTFAMAMTADAGRRRRLEA